MTVANWRLSFLCGVTMAIDLILKIGVLRMWKPWRNETGIKLAVKGRNERRQWRNVIPMTMTNEFLLCLADIISYATSDSSNGAIVCQWQWQWLLIWILYDLTTLCVARRDLPGLDDSILNAYGLTDIGIIGVASMSWLTSIDCSSVLNGIYWNGLMRRSWPADWLVTEIGDLHCEDTHSIHRPKGYCWHYSLLVWRPLKAKYDDDQWPTLIRFVFWRNAVSRLLYDCVLELEGLLLLMTNGSNTVTNYCYGLYSMMPSRRPSSDQPGWPNQ